ncbi:MAG TPA: FAD-linked oxidase C-terminal domain-containing protein [Anaerolineales bacterium]|nr:FAD-linked oxidase C-terminal domain-containing protein [Anaerolineales bacterium]
MTLPADLVNELKKCFTGEIRLDLASRILYSTDASMYQLEPLGVALPRTQEDLHAAVELASRYGIPILPRGSGTSLAGQAIGNALILDCSRWLDSIGEIDPDARTATVEPGVILAKLNSAAGKHGLMFGPDPASAERATMGGVIANNATGAHSLSYGMAADHLISAEVILSDGSLGVLGGQSTLNNPIVSTLYSSALEIREKYADTIKQNWPRTWRNSAGYRLNYLLPWSASAPSQWTGQTYPTDLKPFASAQERPDTLNLAPILAGSEGTLAVIRRATVHLVPRPQHAILAVLAYQSVADACDDVPRLLMHRPSAVELVPQMILRLARSVPAYARQMGWVVGDPAALLVVEFSGDDPGTLRAAARRVGDILTIAESREDQARVWNIRKVGLGLMDSQPQSRRPVAFIEDCAIPVQKLGEFVREIETILAAHGTEGGIYAHASAGCLHIRPILDLKTAKGVTALRSISEAVLGLTLRLGGAMSSEHGDGLSRSEFLEQTYGAEVMEAMRSLKRAADPHNMLNPGKIIDAPKMDRNLRYGTEYRARAWETTLSFARNGGLEVAIEQCNGQGVCRKDSGVMCPSYQATREEMHSTRGRANLLRALISSPVSLRAVGEAIPSANGRLLRPVGARNDLIEATAAALDLCLACKGCKAECPSGVDMAKLKYAFQAEYYKSHRRKLRDYVFGYFHVTARLAASVAPLSNALMGAPVIRKAVARLLGITPHRPFPKFTRKRAMRITTETQGRGEKVIFLADAFSRYVEPGTEQAVLDILSACGYEVHVLPVIGAGAAFLSKGFIDQARRHAGRVLDLLERVDSSRQVAIVGIEPPEIYALKHDYLDLLPARASEIIARMGNVWLLDEFLLRSAAFYSLRVVDSGRDVVSAKLKSQTVRFHPHCHQRAEGPSPDGLPNGTNATVELLRLCGYDVELMDAGCCGMAGTFGYEAEHYDLSMKVGELKLLPLLRDSSALAGTSPKSGEELADNGSAFASGFGGGWEGVVASGAACRMQIQHGTGVEALHPVMLVAGFVKERSIRQ